MNLRVKILRRLFPEVYQQLDKMEELILAYQGLKDSLQVENGNIRIEGPAGILGNLNNCKIEISPTINTELVLSKYGLEDVLRMMGNQQIVTQCLFDNINKKETIKLVPTKVAKEVKPKS